MRCLEKGTALSEEFTPEMNDNDGFQMICDILYTIYTYCTYADLDYSGKKEMFKWCLIPPTPFSFHPKVLKHLTSIWSLKIIIGARIRRFAAPFKLRKQNRVWNNVMDLQKSWFTCATLRWYLQNLFSLIVVKLHFWFCFYWIDAYLSVRHPCCIPTILIAQ